MVKVLEYYGVVKDILDYIIMIIRNTYSSNVIGVKVHNCNSGIKMYESYGLGFMWRVL